MLARCRSTRTGWKVPAPTCSVTCADSTPLLGAAPPESRSSKCSPAVGAATAPSRRAIHRLIALAVGAAFGSRSIYGGNGMWPWRSSSASASSAASSSRTKNSRPSPRARISRLEGTLQLQTRPRLGRLARCAPGPGKRCASSTRSSSILRCDHRWPCATVQARGNHPSIVQHQQIARTQQSRAGRGKRRWASSPLGRRRRAAGSRCAARKDSGRSARRGGSKWKSARCMGGIGVRWLGASRLGYRLTGVKSGP
jgi:hypothetical protein